MDSKYLYIKYLLLVAITLFFASASFAQTITPRLTPSTKKVTPTPTPFIVEKPLGGIHLSLTPIFINLASDPGNPVTTTVKIYNNNTFTEYLQINVAKFTAEAGGERPTIVDVGPEDVFAQWLTFSETKFAIRPLETKTITVTINVPKDAALGYYYALVFNRIEENIPEKKTEAYVVGAPVLPILLDVRSPYAKREMQIVDVKTDKLFYEYLPVQFLIKVKNTGNIHVVPQGNIFIDWGGRRDLAKLDVNDTKSNVLPQNIRTYDTAWADSMIVRQAQQDDQGEFLRDKNGEKIIKTTWHFDRLDRFRFGRYVAHILLIYDNGQRDIPLEATVSFWVIPWKILLVALVVTYLVIIGLKDTVAAQIRKFRKSPEGEKGTTPPYEPKH